jgi:tetratricopeptide (TPR) repeat protein
MHLETKNREAFEQLREAQLSLNLFQESKHRSDLEKACGNLKQALQIDPQYLRALYYRGLVNDMMGKSTAAVSDFEAVLKESPPFVVEVKYNLGVATFHRYGHPNLKHAIDYFKDVLENTGSEALQLRARAGIAHAYAMIMIPKLKEKTEDCQKVENYLRSEDARDHVSEYHKMSVDESEKLAKALKRHKRLEKPLADEMTWRLCNTRAVQRMFLTDYFEQDRIEKLLEAENYLREADTISPNNWSVYCNFASTYMRLGHWLKTQKDAAGAEVETYFQQAIGRLDNVILELLPRYGFALYEKGRVCRLSGDFKNAETYLKEALTIAEEDRAVSTQTLNCELWRVERQSTDYPFSPG